MIHCIFTFLYHLCSYFELEIWWETQELWIQLLLEPPWQYPWHFSSLLLGSLEVFSALRDTSKNNEYIIIFISWQINGPWLQDILLITSEALFQQSRKCHLDMDGLSLGEIKNSFFQFWIKFLFYLQVKSICSNHHQLLLNGLSWFSQAVVLFPVPNVKTVCNNVTTTRENVINNLSKYLITFLKRFLWY